MTELASALKFASENTEFDELLPSFPEQWRDECEVDGAQNLATQIEFDVWNQAFWFKQMANQTALCIAWTMFRWTRKCVTNKMWWIRYGSVSVGWHCLYLLSNHGVCLIKDLFTIPQHCIASFDHATRPYCIRILHDFDSIKITYHQIIKDHHRTKSISAWSIRFGFAGLMQLTSQKHLFGWNGQLNGMLPTQISIKSDLSQCICIVYKY